MYPKKRCILLYPYKVVYHKLSRWFVEIKDASFSPRGSAAVWGLARGDESQQRKGVVEKPWKKQWVEPGRNRGNHPWHPEFFWWKKPGYLCAGKKHENHGEEWWRIAISPTNFALISSNMGDFSPCLTDEHCWIMHSESVWNGLVYHSIPPKTKFTNNKDEWWTTGNEVSSF